MKNRKIYFTGIGRAELLCEETPDSVSGNELLLRTDFSAISAGTERDNLRAEPNVSGKFPCQFGYSASATVLAAGSECKRFKPGDRVIVPFQTHSEYTYVAEDTVFPIFDGISSEEAALLVISSFPAEGVRKTRLEFGESAMVVGLGILGQMAVQFCRIAGAVNVIACDPDPERQELALKLGADAALDPLAPDFYSKLLSSNYGRRPDVAIDVAGRAEATVTALGALTKFGRISLLGCTRHPGVYDFYHLIHSKGVQVFGAHTLARPDSDSRPGCWTYRDDIFAVQKLICGRRFDMKSLISEIHSPEEAPEVYSRLTNGKFPIGVLFDWSKLR